MASLFAYPNRDPATTQVILLIFAYTGIVPTARSCSVSFTDAEGVTHAVEITASSLYEAAVVAMAEFRKHGFAEATFGPATQLNVRVKAPEAAHVVSVGHVKAWLDRVGKSPRDQVEKNRLKYLLTR